MELFIGHCIKNILKFLDLSSMCYC